MIERLLRWTLFSVLLGLTPVVARAASQTAGLGMPQMLQWITPQGELLLISVVLSGNAVGQLFGSGTNRRLRKVVSGGITLLLLVFTALFFAYSYGNGAPPAGQSGSYFINTSLWLFAGAAISGAFCVGLAEV